MHDHPWRRAAVAAALATAFFAAAWPDALVAAWRQVVGLIAVTGEPIAASPAIVSEHELLELDALLPQAQAERMLERAINHYAGATDEIDKRIESWVGKVAMEGSLGSLYTTAVNANDLRVRAAALEIYLAANGGRRPGVLSLDRRDLGKSRRRARARARLSAALRGRSRPLDAPVGGRRDGRPRNG
jgi:hypothetical protein